MRVVQREPFLAWPGWAHLRTAWWQTALVSVWFAFVSGPSLAVMQIR